MVTSWSRDGGSVSPPAALVNLNTTRVFIEWEC